MKASPGAQRTLLELQSADSAVERLEHRLRAMPEVERAASARAQQQRAAADAVRAATAVSDLQRAVRRAEDDVAAVRARIDRDRSLLDSGAITSARQVTDLDHELASLARRQSDLEDAELEVLEQLEAAENAVTAAQEAASTAESAVATAETDLAAATTATEAELTVARRDRAEAAAKLPPELLEHYEQLRARGGYIVAALLRARRCEACQMELATADVGAARTADPDEILHCPECGAILVRTEESGL